ncbi:glycosyltransferase family 4 protein [Marinobacter sp. F4206]|uniref:glycosyltransferase family 4 protein n=1 Tax=Marinobacter sp. F4206 TaxID=2861777 RepID=UPI001C604A1F|nr:glycosyltransferase family 4 protein [Marinobacter sp. F4206]MBW4933438.1 glycosyltransferase family 4 protein [Marinobacter sp. F4206]
MLQSDSSWAIEFVVPGDPHQNTGGYRYVRLLAEALSQSGFAARVIGLPGSFPRPDAEAANALDRHLGACTSGALVVLDGLAMGGLPDVVAAHASRLNLIALVHHPLADETGLSATEQQWFFEHEKRALAAAGKVITTSRFTAERLSDYGVPAERIRTVEPGVSPIVESSKLSTSVRVPGDGPNLLCVAHLSPRKAQHHLIEALSELETLPWHCTLAGATDRNPAYSDQVRAQVESAGLGSRVDITGEVSRERLGELYHQADLFVFPSLYEGYGMVIDEALAAGLPVIASNGGALSQTAARGGVVQYEAGDVGSLSARLAAWLAHPRELVHRTRLAEQESARIKSWRQAASNFQSAVADLAVISRQSVFDSEWLRCREGADHAARVGKLTSDLGHWLRKTCLAQDEQARRESGVTVVDLGAGRGSNAVYLVPALPLPQQWLLLDQDAALLAEARERLTSADIGLSISQAQLSAGSLDRHIPDEVSLVTASALIDLVSKTWLKALVDAVVARQSALLVVLSYAGRFDLNPPHKHDARLRALVNRHQHRDKGVGQALGAGATPVLKGLMESAGYTVTVADSLWRLGKGDAVLIGKLIQGWVEAAREQDSAGTDWLAGWLADRREQLTAGNLFVTVHHVDLLALPADRQR